MRVQWSFGLAVAFAALTSSAAAQTPAGTVQQCEFARCDMSTGECCRLAREQAQSCRATLEADRDNYANFGSEGEEAKAATEECVRCSEVFLAAYCSSQ